MPKSICLLITAFRWCLITHKHYHLPLYLNHCWKTQLSNWLVCYSQTLSCRALYQQYKHPCLYTGNSWVTIAPSQTYSISMFKRIIKQRHDTWIWLHLIATLCKFKIDSTINPLKSPAKQYVVFMLYGEYKIIITFTNLHA